MIFERFLKTLFCLFIFSIVRSQDFSNKGTEFWVGYGYHQVMTNGLSTQNAQDMVLYFTSDVAATVKVEIPLLGWSKTYQVAANSVTESDPMPKAGAQDARPNVRKDGLEIVFDSTRGGGAPDIYTASRSSIFDPWSAPVPLGSDINSASSETRATLSP